MKAQPARLGFFIWRKSRVTSRGKRLSNSAEVRIRRDRVEPDQPREVVLQPALIQGSDAIGLRAFDDAAAPT